MSQKVRVIVDGTLPRGIILHNLSNVRVTSAYDDMGEPPPHTKHSVLELRPGLNTVELEALEKNLAARDEYLVLSKCSDIYVLTATDPKRRAGTPAAADRAPAPSAEKTTSIDDIFHK